MSKHFFPAGQGDELIHNIFQSNQTTTIPTTTTKKKKLQVSSIAEIVNYCTHLLLIAGDKSIITNIV
jgi:hypothetical protein